MIARLLLCLLAVASFGFAQGHRGDPVGRILVYGDSLWDGCDPCEALTDEGWTVLNTAVAGATIWESPAATCISPYPNNSVCTDLGVRLLERSPGVCAAEADWGDGVVQPSCLRSLARRGDIVVIQIGTNDVARSDWANEYENLVKPEWLAVMDEVEDLGLTLVVIHSIPRYQNFFSGTLTYTTVLARQEELRTWLRASVLAGRATPIVEVDLYDMWETYETNWGETALLGLYKSCPAKGTLSGVGDCTHYQNPGAGHCPNSAGHCSPTLAGEAIKNGIYHARALRGSMPACTLPGVLPCILN